MAILKRINKYQGLKDIDILVEETGLTSQYFQVYDFPDQVPQGKSSFLVAGSPFLADNVELKVEILDAGGNTVYTEAITNYLEGGARRVSIEVYDDVIPGDGFMYIVGELKKNYNSITALNSNKDEITDTIVDPDMIAGLGGEDVPPEFQGVYNVRYARPIFINASLPNSQPIFFYQQPRVTITEVVKPFIEQLAPSGSVVLSGSIEANPAPDLIPLPAPIAPPPGFPKNPTAEGLGQIGQINEIFKSSKKSKSNPFRNSGFRSRGRLVRRSSPEQDRFSMRIHQLEESNETTKDKASSALIGATLTIKSPKVDLVKYPTEEFDVPTSFNTSIKKVLNEETIVPVDDFFITRRDTLERIPVPIIADEVAGGGQSEVTMSYTPFPEQSLSATHNRSFADVTVANLRTFSGDVYKTKIYGKSQGSLGDFELLHEGTIESPQTLIDPYSVDGFLNIGYFHTQSIVDNYWLLSGGSAARDDSKILDGIEISGSNYAVGSSVELTTSGSFALEKGVPYSVTFNAYYFKEDKVQDTGEVVKEFDLDVLISEAALIGGTLSDTYQSVGKVDIGNNNLNEGSIPGIYTTFITPSDIGPTLKLKFKLNAGRAIINDVVVRPHAETNFNPDYFRVVLPMAYPLPKQPDLYDFLVEFYDVNNNIAETFTIGQNIEFTGAPLNIDGEDNLLSGSLYIGSTQGSGFEMAGVSSAFLRSIGYNGFDKTIAESKGGFLLWSGSIGDRLTASEDYDGVGLEIVDAHTSQDRYLKFRTNPSTFEVVTDQFFLGQAGSSFVSGSNGNIEIFSSGTTTLSGSNVDILTPNFYLGGDDNYISGSGGNIDIFNTGTTTLSGSAVLIETPTFFMGGPNAFVSGSGGNVEISSSNFHLTPEGSVTMSGDITANAGYIGDWKIVGGKISGSNITMDASNSTIYKTDQGPGSDSGESFAQLKNEYYLDFTPTTESPDNYYIKMGPNFGVDKDGILFASGAKFEGSITASQGLIGGFTTDSSSFHTDYIFISGSPALGGTDHRRFMFISSSNFNVKQDGDVTGSAVLFTGGKIAGFTIDSTKLKQGSSFHLDGASDATYFISSSNFQVTPSGDISGSQVLFTGGKIAGSGVEIDVNNFELDATDVAISSTHASMSLGHDADSNGGIRLVGTNGGTIAMGDTLPANLTSDGIFMSGSGDFNFQGNSANFIRRVATALTIKAGTFDLDATTLILDSSGDSGTGVIRLGGSGGPNSPTSSTAGIYMDGGGALNVVGNSTNFLRTDAGSLTVNTDTLDLKTNTLRVSSSNGGVIAMGGTLPVKLEQSGIFLSGSGQFSFYSSSRGHIVFDGTDFKIASKNLTIDTSTLDINTAGGGNIALGSGSPSLTAAGIFLSGSGDFNFMKDANNFIRQSGGTFQIKADTFDLATSTLIISSSQNSGMISLGATPNTSIAGTGKGVYMDGTGDFLVRGDSNNFFKFDASGNSVQLKSDTFDLQTTTFSASSAGTGKISLGQTPPTRYDSGNGIFFDGDANFLIGSASGDKIQFTNGDFTVQVGSLELDASNIEISSTNASMSLGEGNIILDGANNKIKVGKTTNQLIEIVGSSTQGYIATGKDSATSTTAGFWLANNNTDPEFAVGDSTDFIRFNGGNLDINSQKLEIAASTLQLSTTEASMSLGHNAQSGSYGRVILEGAGVPTLRIGKQAHTITLATGSGIYMDGDGNFRFGDDDGGIKFNNGNFSITGSDVDIDVTDINITSTGFRLSSTNASMSLGTNDQLLVHANSSSPFLSIGQSTKGYGQTGIFLGYINSVSRPRVSFVGSTGHFKVDQDVDISTETFELDANSGDLQISSAHKSMSLGDQSIVLDGPNKKITVGTGNQISIVGGASDNFITMGSKTGMDSTQGSGTPGIIIGMDGSNPQAEFVKSATEYFIYDNGIDMKTLNFELSANSGNLQISSADKAIRLSSGSTGQVTIQGDGTDGFISMGSKGSFANEGSGSAGIIIGMDGANPQAEFVKNSTNYFIFDDGIDIKTDTFKLDTTRLDIDSSTARISVFDLQDDEVVRIGELTGTNTFGMKIFDGTGTATSNELVKLGGDGNEIAGWTITNDRLSGGNMIIRQDGTIESAGFASDVAGSGFRLTAAQGGFLEVENAKIRGTLATAVFEKESVNAVGGQLYVANSTVLTSSAFAVNAIHTAAQETMSVANVTGFSSGEILSLKKVSSTGFATEYVKVYSASRDDSSSDVNFAGNLFVTRSFGQGITGDSGSLGESPAVSQSYSGSQVIVSTGKLNTGYIRLNANPNDETTPYMDIVERTGSGIYDVDLKVRLGDLSGLSSGLLFGNTTPGFGIFTENGFFSGGITATTGSFTGVVHIGTSDSQKMKLGVDVSGASDGIHINDVNYWYTTGNFKVGDSAGNFISSSGEISTDSLEINAGSGDFQLSTTNHSMSFADGDLLLKKEGSDASITVGGTTSKQITIKGSNTQGYIASGKTSAASLTEGFWIANNDTDAEFHIGDGSSAIKFDDNQLHITSSKFELDAGEGDLQISSLHKSMSLGDGSFEVIGDQSNNLTKLKVGQHTIQNIQMTGSSNAGILKSGKKGINDLNAGFYMSNEAGTAKFHVGDGSSALKFDGSNLHITASQANLSGDGVTIDVNTFELEAANVEISSGQASMSVGYDDNIAGGINIVGGATSTIGFGSKAAPRMKLSSNSTDSYLSIGNIAFDSETTAGILIGSDDGNHEFRIYKNLDEYFTYDASSGFDLKTDSLEIVTAGLTISGRSGTAATNTISLGTITSDSDTIGSGVFMDGGGHFRVFGDANNFMIVDGGSLQIKSDNIDITSTAFSLDANSGDLQLSSTQKSASFANGKIIIEGSSTNGSLQIGGVSSVTDTGGSNKGFYAEGDGDFIAKAGANEYIKFDSGKLGIKASDLSILTTGTNKIKMESSASTPTIALGTTLPTAYNSGDGFYVDGTGKLLLGNSAGNHVKYDGDTLTVAGTINIISGDLAGITATTISGSGAETSASLAEETAGLLEGSSSMQTQVVLNSDGMALKTTGGNTLANYGSTVTLGRTDHAHSTFTSTTITQKDGDDKKVLVAASGVIGLYGNDTEKAVFSSTGSLFRGGAQNTFTRVDSSGMTIVDNGFTQGTFTNGTINLYGNNGTDRKVTIDSDGMRAYYDSNNYTNVSSSGVSVHAGNASTAAAVFGTTVTIRGNNSDADRVVVNEDGLEIYTADVKKAEAKDTGFIAYGDDVNTKAVMSDAGMTIFNDGSESDPGTGVAHYGANMRVGAHSATKSALRVDTSGNLTIGTTGASGISITAGGALTMSGSITATSGFIGNAAAGFTINPTAIYNGKTAIDSIVAGVFIGTTGIALGTGGVAPQFSVTSGGVLVASSATITGAITATSGTFTGAINASGGTFTGNVTAGGAKFGVDVASTNDGLYLDSKNHWYDSGVLTTNSIIATGGTVGGWSISDNKIQAGSSGMMLSGSGVISASNFYVDESGNLTASNADFSGVINSETGFIGGSSFGWIISSGKITSVGGTKKITLDSKNGKMYIGTGTYNNTNTPFYADGSSKFSLGDQLTFDGSNLAVQGNITADTLTANTAGSIAGWVIGTSSLTSTNIGLHKGASAQILIGHATSYSSAKIGFKNDGSGKIANGSFSWDTSGNVTGAGTWTNSATITGGVFQTASSGTRIVISSSTNSLQMYTTSDTSAFMVLDDNIIENVPGTITPGIWMGAPGKYPQLIMAAEGTYGTLPTEGTDTYFWVDTYNGRLTLSGALSSIKITDVETDYPKIELKGTGTQSYVKHYGSGILEVGPALVCPGDITINGVNRTYESHILNGGFNYSITAVPNVWMPVNGTLSEVTSIQTGEYNQFIAPYDGYVEKIMVRSEEEGGFTTVSCYAISNNYEYGTLTTPHTGRIATNTQEMESDDTSYTFPFGDGTADFTAGQSLAFAIDPQYDLNDTWFTVVLKLDPST